MRIHPLANPFLSLRSFSRNESARFYGRDADLVLIQSRLYASRTTLLFAGSGVGKTSLIDARLTPILESHWTIVTQRSWAVRPPLDALGGSIAATAPRSDLGSLLPVEQLERLAGEPGSPRQFLLILDQFEEIFQHWRDTKALDAFAQEVARVVHSPTIDARVLFSMREEFLGELSVFDNLIPDLFNNCYRLKNPTRAEAEEIIEKTAFSEQGVECGPGLDVLLDDLLAAPRAGATAADAAPSTRSRIPMPFLQIVCHRLWEQQMRPTHSVTIAIPRRFLETHAMGRAAAELDHYCREKLEGLSDGERDVAAAAFGFLMTPGGAKMAYPIDVLAIQARVPEDQLWSVLQKLCAPDVRILRQIPGGRGSKPWVELYHDLYARFLSDWKRVHEQARHEEAERRLKEETDRRVEAFVQEAVARNARRLQLYKRLAGVAPLLMVVLLLLFNTYIAYVNHYWPLKQFALAAHTAPDADAYLAARSSVNELKGTVFSRSAQAWWGRYWNQRAQREMLAGQPDHALLSQLRSLQEADDETVRRQLASWLSFGETLRTFRAPEEIVSFGLISASNRVFATLSGCRIIFWERSSGKFLETWSPTAEMLRCESFSAISPDGTHAVIVGTRLDQGLRVRTASVTNLKTNTITWETTAEPAQVTASFSADSGRVVIEIGATTAIVSTSDGRVTRLQIPSRFAAEAAFARAFYSPFTRSLFVKFPDRILLLASDGSGPGSEIPLRDIKQSHPEVEGQTYELVPLPGDRMALVFDRKVVFVAATGEMTGAANRWLNFLSTQVSLTSDGTHVFLPPTAAGLCRMSIDQPACETFVWPPGVDPTFVATSAETALAIDRSTHTLKEFRLVKGAPPTILDRGTRQDVAPLSPDGRWLITTDAESCFLVDLDGDGEISKRLLADKCRPDEFVFSPSGRRLLDVSSNGEPVAIVDPITLDRRTLESRTRITLWASDDYLAMGGPGETFSLWNVQTNMAEAVDEAAGSRLRPDWELDTGNCVTGVPIVLVSPNSRYAAVAESEGLVLYQKRAGRWVSRVPINNASRPCATAFSTDSARLLALLNGSVISVWNTSDGSGVRSLTDRFQPLSSVSFGAIPDSVFAIANPGETNELLLWTLKGPEVPSVRLITSLFARPVPLSGSAFTAAVTERVLAWLSHTGSDLAINARPIHFSLSTEPLSFGMSAGRVVRAAQPAADAKWIIRNYEPRFMDVAPLELPESKSWVDLHDERSASLDIRLDEATGRYQPVSTVDPPPAVAPARQP